MDVWIISTNKSIIINMSSIKKSRNVKKRTNQLKLTSGTSKTITRPTKAKLVAAAQHLNRTRTRRFVLYALGCVVLKQVLRYLSNEVIFAGPTTPGGIGFLLFFYVQTGLTVIIMLLLIAASITYLRSLSSDF